MFHLVSPRLDGKRSGKKMLLADEEASAQFAEVATQLANGNVPALGLA